VTLVVPGGPAGVRSRSGTLLASSYTASFTIEAASVLRLQQLLAELDYLPLAFVPPAGSSSGSSSALAHEPTTSSAIPLDPQPGSFAWRFPNIPPSLAALWQPGAPNVITTGAVMAFESDHGLADDGVAGPLVWSALLQAVAQRQVDTAPYDYVMVSTALPETLRVWRDGTVIFSSLANTGIPASPTQLGTWPVYLRYLSTTMSGYNPDGTYYSDPGVPWVSYFHGGDAIHGFLRASYGFPQSLGCVELPYAAAETVWPMTPIGTLVTVS
jgi:peptidoglycan hydrolase-like protein with peptidoglycan-binding domain